MSNYKIPEPVLTLFGGDEEKADLWLKFRIEDLDAHAIAQGVRVHEIGLELDKLYKEVHEITERDGDEADVERQWRVIESWKEEQQEIRNARLKTLESLAGTKKIRTGIHHFMADTAKESDEKVIIALEELAEQERWEEENQNA